MSKIIKSDQKIVLFEWKKVRKVIYRDEWWFSVEDVIFVLTNSQDPKQYVKKMKARDEQLKNNWGTVCTLLEMMAKDGKKRKILAANTEWIFRIIQSIPSSKAEPFKRWLAKIWYERIQEIENPELAQERMKKIYEQKWYPTSRIDKRLRGVAVRQTLTDEWQNRGVETKIDYAILTNEIMQSAFWMNVSEYKEHKWLNRHNLRDHMTDLELILTMLWEATTTKFHQDRDSQQFDELKKDAKDGWGVAGRTREDIDVQSNESIVSNKNYLNLNEQEGIEDKKNLQ